MIASYTESDVVARPSPSLILALNEAGKLRYAGHVGTGFTHAELVRPRVVMKPLERATSPLTGTVPADVRCRAVWVEPRLVVQMAFTEMTTDGMVRHPSYRGIREDKPPSAVHLERPAPTAKLHAARRDVHSCLRTPAPMASQSCRIWHRPSHTWARIMMAGMAWVGTARRRWGSNAMNLDNMENSWLSRNVDAQDANDLGRCGACRRISNART